MYNKNNLEYEEQQLGYIVNKNKVLMPYTFTTVYIMFNDNYNFSYLPKGFNKINNNTIEMIIDYC